MGGNPPTDIRLTHPGQLAQERDHTAIEKALPHQVVAILEEILSGLVGFAIQESALIWPAHTLPYLNGIGEVGRDGHIELPSHLVGGNPEIAKVCGGFDRHPMFIAHFRCPLSSHAPDTQSPDLIGTTGGGHPHESDGPLVGQGILGIGRMGM
jgi:hypothetical protein